MIARVKPDRQKSGSLKKMAEITLERLNKTDMDKYPSNTLLDYYDAIHKLLYAIAPNPLFLSCHLYEPLFINRLLK